MKFAWNEGGAGVIGFAVKRCAQGCPKMSEGKPKQQTVRVEDGGRGEHGRGLREFGEWGCFGLYGYDWIYVGSRGRV